MANTEQSPPAHLLKDCVLVPIHRPDGSTPLVICVLARTGINSPENLFVLLRDLPGIRIYRGAVCDALSRIQEWVEIHVQTVDVKHLEFSGYQDQLSNTFFDLRWQKEGTALHNQMPGMVIGTKMENENPAPILVRHVPPSNNGSFVPVEAASWQICKDDALLHSHDLPAYSTTPFRYLFQPGAAGAKTFLATSIDAPLNSHTQGLERFGTGSDILGIFNPGCGFVRIVRYSPLDLENCLQILEGKAWSEEASEIHSFPANNPYAALQGWSSNPKGLPFLLSTRANAGDLLNEILLLKMSLLHDLFKKVRAFVKEHQLPFLNLSPASFRVHLQETSDLFPRLWSAEAQLVKPGQAYPLQIKSTEQKYFIRLGRIEPSPFFPEGMGAHSFGIGSAQIRDANATVDSIVLEGTLVAEDYLAIDPHDLLWFKLPLGDERLEFYGHVYKSDTVGPREARFRTIPATLPAATMAKLKSSAGLRFAKSPYEVWPLLSSPCDLYSLGVIALRILLANSQKKLPILLDEILSLARRINDISAEKDKRIAELQKMLQKEQRLFELLSPGTLVETGYTPKQAWAAVHSEIWLETINLLLRTFPGTGDHGFCKSFGDVTPLALEVVFDGPLQELELLILRLRSLLTPSHMANEEIAGVILEQIAKN